MAVYTGQGTFPYWMTIANSGGASGVSAVSENIPVTVGLNYQFQVICSFGSTWASGVNLSLTFYDASGNVLQTNTGTQANMTGGVLYQVNTGLVTAPSSSSYAVAQIILNGSPGAANALNVYQAEIDDQNYTQVNINFAFTWTFWPWSPSSSNATLGWNFAPTLAGDFDSLVLDGIIELMGGPGGTPCTVPELADSNGVGPTFRLLAPPSLNSAAFGYESSYDLNAPQPTQDVVASMLLDGERPFGDRASNRTMNLPIIIFGTQAGGMSQVLKAREYLMSVIDQQTWQIKWTSVDTGLPILFDCFRALPTAQVYGFNYSAGNQATGSGGRSNYPIAMMTAQIQALPYGRSEIDGVQTLAFNSPLTNGVPTVSPASIDTFNTVFNPPPIISKPTFTATGTSTQTSTSAPSVTLSANVAAGNTQVVVIETSADSVTGVTDTQGNVYTLAQKNNTSSMQAYTYIAPVQSALASGTDHINVAASATQNWNIYTYYVQGAWSIGTQLASTNAAKVFQQDYEEGTNGTTLTTGNTAPTSSFPSELACSSVTIGTGCTATFDNSWAAHGTLSAKFASTGTPAASFHTYEPVLGTLQQWFRFSANFGAIGTAYAVAQFNATPAVHGIFIILNANGTITVEDHNAAILFTTATVLSAGTSYRFEGFVVGDTSVGQASLSIYAGDSTTPLETRTTTANKNTGGIITDYGIGVTSAVANTSLNIDDVAFSSTGPIGPYVQPGIYSATLPVNQYNLLLSSTFGQSFSGATPANFTSIATPSGNGYNATLSWAAVPINTTSFAYSVTALGNPWALTVTSLTPVNQYWNWDITTPPPTFVGHSAHYTPPRPYKRPYPAATYQQTLISPANIVGCTVLSMYFGQAYDVQWPKDPKFISNCTFQWTLTDNLGRTLKFSVAKKKVLYGTHPTAPKWTQINAAIPQGRTNFNYNAVASYTLRITNWSEAGNTGYIRMHAWINDIQANPPTIQNAMSPRGSVYNLFSLPGSARSPISVQCQLPAAQNITKEITSPASGNWIVPPGVYSVQAEGWGGGGAGAATNLARNIAGGGGGGGEYAAEPALSVMPGWRIPWSIGAAGTPGQLQNTVIQYTKSGLGHWTCPANVSTVIAEVWGGGAAGGAGAGGGGGAEYAKARINVTPGVTYNLWTGSGGKADVGTSAAQVKARQGEASWFAAPSVNSPVLALTTAQGGKTSATGSTSGGNGGTSGTVAPGTQFACIATKTNTATKTVIYSPNTGASALAAGVTGMIVVTVPAAATISIKDTSSNNWSLIGGPVTNTGVFTYVFWCLSAKALNKASVITITQSVNQPMTVGTYSVPWVCGQDAANTGGSGASTSPTITSSAPNSTGDLVIAIFSNSAANTNSNPGGWTTTPHLGTAGAGGFTDVYAIQNPLQTTETATAGYASSQSWCAISLSLATEIHWPGGRGGSSPGPSGGGGGGAAGATGAGGTGGDSAPMTSGVGRWAQGGVGGTGTGQGGNGGAGSNTPGFPGTGAQPGGGGGGGYQSNPLFNAANPSNVLPGQQQTNYLGGDGGIGMVQLTYTVGGGSPVNGGNTTFGSAGTTGTVLTAHGGTSAANNSAAGGNGGTGSTNTTHFNGGAGGLNTGGALGSYMASPSVTTLFQTLANGAYSSTANTSGTAGSSCSQGVAIALIESTAQVTDLVVTDSAGNQYQNNGVQKAGGSANGVTVYAYVANIEFPITTSTTLTISSATSQQYGFLWYASPWLVAGITPGNSGAGHGTSSSFTGTFGISDNVSIELELGVVLSDGSTTVSNLTQTKTWFNAGSTNTQAAGTMNMAAYVMETQGGGNGTTGDVFSGTLSGSANWAVLCVPLLMINQTNAMIRIDQRSGSSPGASSSWTFNPAISANGMLLVLGASSASGAASAGPTGVVDASGNSYTKLTSVGLNASASVWAFTAPVTASMAANVTGQVRWGAASAANGYDYGVYWVPNATGVDASGASAVTGSSTNPTGTYTGASPNDFLVGLTVNAASALLTANPASPWNYADDAFGNPFQMQIFEAQATDLAATTFSGTFSSSHTWLTLLFGLVQTLSGTGGGAAGNPGGPGYPGVWAFGGPGFGGGKGGQGAAPPPQGGGGGALFGGGGGGALGSSAAPQEGGQGAPGGLRLTWTPPLQTLNTLLVHSLGPNADPNVNPIVPIPITDVPNNTEYAIPSVNGILNASFNSTYTVLLSNFFWNNSTSSAPRQITVTINQYEFPGGPKYSYQVSRAVTPATDVVNGLLSMGEVTLPVKDYISYNDQSYFTVSINDTDTADRFQDVIFLDTLGQTVLINIDPGQPGYGQYVNFFIDEATSDRDLGFVGASMQDRQHQISVLDYTQISGGPLFIGPGDNLFLVYSTSGAPSLSVTYAPRWYLDRSV